MPSPFLRPYKGALVLVALFTIALFTTAAFAASPIAPQLEITHDVIASADAMNMVGFDLYDRMRVQNGNFLFSPASIDTALTMVFLGTAGDTEEEMTQALHYDNPGRLPKERIPDAFGTLTQLLNSDGKSDGYHLRLANRLWAQNSFEFRPTYLELTRERFGAELARVDFATQPEEARRQINAWVAQHTEGKIEDLIAPGALGEDTRLALTNAIYFQGAWENEFPNQGTEDLPFHLNSDSQTNVPTMSQQKRFNFRDESDMQVLEMPFRGNEVSMIILLPKEKTGLGNLETRLTAPQFKTWINGLRSYKVNVYLPKFHLTSDFNLATTLRGTGMPTAFSPRADLSLMSDDKDLYLSEVVHKAFINVDEKGTEAGASSAVLVSEASLSRPDDKPFEFRADHPFIFIIRDMRTNAVLFLGRVTNPAS